MHRDTVIGIVGVVILVAAMVGVFTYERGQAASLGTDGGGLALANFPGPGADGTVALGATADSEIVLNQTGLTNITFTITWSAGANSRDTLKVIAQPANDTGMTMAFESDPENDGEIVLTIPVNNTASTDMMGAGNWRISVEFVSAQLAGPVGPPAPPAVPADTSVDYALTTGLQAYAPATA